MMITRPVSREGFAGEGDASKEKCSGIRRNVRNGETYAERWDDALSDLQYEYRDIYVLPAPNNTVRESGRNREAARERDRTGMGIA